MSGPRMSPLPRLLSLATAVPPHTVPQDLVVDNAMRLFDRDRSEIRRMLSVFGNAGIEHRYSCMPGEWYLEPHGWVERSRLFVEHAAMRLEVPLARHAGITIDRKSTRLN